MRAIRSKATKPELLVRKWLWSHGYRYRLNVRSVPGSADIVMRKYRTAIFVNGCFWHRHRVRIDNRAEGDARLEAQSSSALPKTHSRPSEGLPVSFEDPISEGPQWRPCKYATMPKSNADFWNHKFAANQARDERNYRLLQEAGWQVVILWTCQLTPALLEQTMNKVAVALNENLLKQYMKSII